MDDESVVTPLILNPQGRLARKAIDRSCPKCGASPDLRVPSAGFGRDIHDVCRRCGHEFAEFTRQERDE